MINNKKIMIILIIVVLIAIVGVFGTVYFYQKSLHVDSDIKLLKFTPANEMQTTEIRKYHIKENEEKDIVINNKKINIRRTKENYYINDNEIKSNKNSNGSSYYTFYTTNNFLLFDINNGLFGQVYEVYDLDGKKIDTIGDINGYNIFDFDIHEKDLVAIIYDAKLLNYDGIHLDDINLYICIGDKGIDGEIYKKIEFSKYSELYEKHKKDVLQGWYKVKYIDGKMNFELEDPIETIEDFFNKYEGNICDGFSN